MARLRTADAQADGLHRLFHGWTDRAVEAGRASVDGRSRGLRALLPFAGPAIIASVAYMDPGNFATNIEAGAKYGYTLLWVVLFANVAAMLFQAQSAKLGIVTGRSLASLCAEHFPAPLVYAMWIVSEIGAMATDLAEFLGAAIGMSLLTNWPLLACLCLTGLVTYAMLMLERAGFRPMEALIAAFVGVIGASYVVELWIAPPRWLDAAAGLVTPRLADQHAVALAVGIVGATIMPHAIYLHSSLTRARVPVSGPDETRRALKYSNIEVLIALGFAGLVNIAMVCMSASVFHTGHSDVAEIETAYRTLIPLLGRAAAGVFMISLLASGLSSSVVGTMAGQGIMQDFVRFKIPLWLRRLLTMIPAFVVVWLGFGATDSLVYSQIVLSLVLPVPMLALLYFGARRDIMGDFVVSRGAQALSIVAAGLILLLNAALLLSAAGIDIPFLGS